MKQGGYLDFEMLLKKIILNNIRSYENQEIRFPDGSVLLAGDIGAGKTSILLGIEFALFGLQPGQKGVSLLRGGEDEGGVRMEFEVENKEIIIERKLKRGKTVSQDYCAITIDGEKKEISVSELKSKILEILSYPSEFAKKQNLLYKFTVYTPQEEMKQIILQDSETRMNTMRHVFGIDKYKKILENVSLISSKLREEKRMSEGMTINLEHDKLDLISKKEKLGEKNSTLFMIKKELTLKIEKRKEVQEEQIEVRKKIEEKNHLIQEIEKTKIMISSKNQNTEDNNQTLRILEEQIANLQKFRFDESEISNLETSIGLLKKDKESVNREILIINSQINSLHLRIEDNKNLEKKISNLEICPTCLQDVDAVYRANVLNKIHSNVAEANKTLSELDEKNLSAQEKMKNINSEIYSAEDKLNNLKILRLKLQGVEEKQKRFQEIKLLNDSCKKDIDLLNQHITLLQNSVSELSIFDGLFESKQLLFDEKLREERIAEIKVAELKKEIEVFSRQIDEMKEGVKKTEKIKEKLDYITMLEDWLSRKFVPIISAVEKNVMAKLKSEFSNFFEKWFCMLVSDSFDVMLREDFTPVIEQRDYEIDYDYLSGGERTAVALAYRLALNQVINSLLSKIKTKDLVILDEPTDGFSEQQLDKMRDVLQELDVKQLIIVSHEQKIESFVENVIRFKKDGGISEIESSLLP